MSLLTELEIVWLGFVLQICRPDGATRRGSNGIERPNTLASKPKGSSVVLMTSNYSSKSSSDCTLACISCTIGRARTSALSCV